MVEEDSLFWIWLKKLPELVQTELPRSVNGPMGIHGVVYTEDENGFLCAIVGLNFPKGVYAEIDGGTYGTMQGVRIYLENEEQPFDDALTRSQLLSAGGF